MPDVMARMQPSGRQAHLAYESSGIVFALEDDTVTNWLTYVVE